MIDGPRLAKILMRGARHIERAEQVDINHRLERIGRHAERGSGKISSRAGNQHVKIAELLVSGGQRRRDRSGIAHIGRAAHRLSAELGKLLNRALDLVGGATCHRQIGAMRRKGARNAEVDAAGAAGDEYRAAGEVERVHGALTPIS